MTSRFDRADKQPPVASGGNSALVPAALLAALLATWPAAVGAVPPPPPPMARLSGGEPLCGRQFAIMLAEDESAIQYDADHWVVNGPGFSLGIRSYGHADAIASRDSLRGNQPRTTAVIPDRGRVERHRVFEWPGGRARGWAYWIPRGGGEQPDYVLLASDEFVGSDADYARLRRVSIGEESARLCPPAPPNGLDRP